MRFAKSRPRWKDADLGIVCGPVARRPAGRSGLHISPEAARAV